MFTSRLVESYVLFLLLLSLLSSACSPRISDNIPTVRYQNLRVEQIQPELEQANLKLKLAMRFRFKNPLNQDIVIPAHDLTFKLNEQEVSGDISQQPSFTLHGKSEELVAYHFTFDLSPEGVLKDLDVLGKDNYFELVSEFKVDLADFGIDLPDRFSKYTFEVVFGDTIRLPLLPTVKAANQLAKVRLLGQMEELDLLPYKNAAQPFVNLLNSNFKEQDPFVKLLADSKVPGTNIKVIDQVINTFFAANNTAKIRARNQWNALKDKLYIEDSVSVMDQMVTTFLKHINTNAASQWNTFNSKWSDFYANIPDKLEYPGHRITGLFVEIPFIIENPNQFSIEAPTLVGSTDLASFQPVVFGASPVGSTGSIAAGEGQLMKIRMSLNWSDEKNPGLGWLLNGELLQPTLKGNTRVDLGYGPLELNMEIPINLQVGQ
ncbi:hypothetical protein OKW21_005282 [Catalinimonas alkaloidigena]|uniref:hypothetical protein n=1 Tax=Catalinimonas alkaloidigena TaxID=1075417 RepID=UPI0024070EB9|nr:hypothetical protein [Catalinimonas alkaloidigena]MDF9800019.1 hypothetical protein [Catalinimonas alkaloidigena]